MACAEPRCPNPATSRGRCDPCRRKLERERSARRRTDPRSAIRVKTHNSKKWKLTRAAVLRRDPICTECDQRLSEVVHHIKAIVTHPELRFEMSNLRGLCAKCHNAITRAEQAA